MKKLPSYEEAIKENQCVIDNDYTFVVEAKKGFVMIFCEEWLLVEEPILNKANYEQICHYWTQLTKNSQKEKDDREFQEYYEMLEMDF